ncbi:MAG: RNA polymerase sigma-70 factor, partial [Odoribacter sp.]
DKDQDIIRDFSMGRGDAFRLLYEKYASALRYFASKYIDDDAVIDDIVQDAFVALWEQRADFTIENAVKAFLYKIVKNSSLNLLRHQGVKNRYAEAMAQEEDVDSFLDNILESEIFELLLTVFDELPPACREIYRLSLDGKKHEEIAEELHITVNTVKKQKNNANHYMRERLKHILIFLIFISNLS